jgi:hypothetical protein
MTPPRLTNRDPQILDAFRQQGKPPLRQIDGEEEAASGQDVAAVTGHAAALLGCDGYRCALHPSYGLPGDDENGVPSTGAARRMG